MDASQRAASNSRPSVRCTRGPDSSWAKTETCLRYARYAMGYRTTYNTPRRRTGANIYLSSSARKKKNLPPSPVFRHGSPNTPVPAPVRLMMMEWTDIQWGYNFPSGSSMALEWGPRPISVCEGELRSWRPASPHSASFSGKGKETTCSESSTKVQSRVAVML